MCPLPAQPYIPVHRRGLHFIVVIYSHSRKGGKHSIAKPT